MIGSIRLFIVNHNLLWLCKPYIAICNFFRRKEINVKKIVENYIISYEKTTSKQ